MRPQSVCEIWREYFYRISVTDIWLFYDFADLGRFSGGLSPRCSALLSRTLKGTSLSGHTRFGEIVPIGQDTWPWRVLFTNIKAWSQKFSFYVGCVTDPKSQTAVDLSPRVDPCSVRLYTSDMEVDLRATTRASRTRAGQMCSEVPAHVTRRNVIIVEQ